MKRKTPKEAIKILSDTITSISDIKCFYNKIPDNEIDNKIIFSVMYSRFEIDLDLKNNIHIFEFKSRFKLSDNLKMGTDSDSSYTEDDAYELVYNMLWELSNRRNIKGYSVFVDGKSEIYYEQDNSYCISANIKIII